MFAQGLYTDAGQQNVKQHTQSRSRYLDQQKAGASQIVGGAGNDDTAEARSQQAQKQQHPVAFFYEVLYDTGDPLHMAGILSRRFQIRSWRTGRKWVYCTTERAGSKYPQAQEHGNQFSE